MDIVIISNFPSNLDGGIKGRFLYLGELFASRSHQVELVVSDFDHERKRHRSAGSISRDEFLTRITVLPEIGYRRNVSLLRLLSHFLWGLKVRKYLNNREKPDIVYCAIPSLTAAKAAATFCKKNSIKFAIDVQDLWPEAFAMVIKNRLLQNIFLPMKWYADKVYAAADMAIAVSDTYVKRVLSVNKQLQSGLSVFLGNDGEAFDQGRASYHLERSDDEVVIGYIGNMSTSYDIPCVLDALSIVEREKQVKKSVRFVLIGTGVDESAFREYASKTYLNTCFLGKRDYKEMAGLLCDCDIAVNPIVKGSVASIINKVGDYALAGLPVINTQESPEYRELINNFKCGINCECSNAHEVAEAIVVLISNPTLCDSMGKASRKLAEEKFDRRKTYMKVVMGIENLVEK